MGFQYTNIFEYKDVEVNLGIVVTGGVSPTIDDVIADLKKTNTLYRIFEIASDVIDKENPSGKPCQFRAQFKIEGMAVCGVNINQFEFVAAVKKIVQNLKIPSVVAYDAPEVKAAQRNVIIEKVAFGDFEITQSSNKVFVAADLTPVECPPNCQFKYFGFDFGRIVCMESFEILGLPKFVIPIEKIAIGLSINAGTSV